MLDLDSTLLAAIAIMLLACILTPFGAALNFKYFGRRLRSTRYFKSYRIGWLLSFSGIELMEIGFLLGLFSCVGWIPFTATYVGSALIISALGAVCALAGFALTQDPYAFLRNQKTKLATAIVDTPKIE